MPAPVPAPWARFRTLLDRHGVAVGTGLLLVLLCWIVAQRTWVHLGFLAPKPRAVAASGMPAADAESSARVAASQLFGALAVEAAPPPGAAPAPVAQAPLNAHLKGVYAETGPAEGLALLNLGGRDQPFRAGTEIAPGVKLVAVYPRYVEIQRGPARERIELEDRGGGAGAPQPVAVAVPPPPGAPGAPGGSPFRLNVQSTGEHSASFSRTELNIALQDPKQITNIGRVANAPNGGIMLEGVPPGSLTDKLGLKQGDVLRQINGQSVNSQGDLAKLYQEFGQTSQVRVQGERAGRPLLLTFNILP
jgi:general secretion pathway protein C